MKSFLIKYHFTTATALDQSAVEALGRTDFFDRYSQTTGTAYRS